MLPCDPALPAPLAPAAASLACCDACSLTEAPVPRSRRGKDGNWRSILEECSDVFVKQHVEYMEALTGFETENKYSVFGPSRGPFPQGEALFACKTS